MWKALKEFFFNKVGPISSFEEQILAVIQIKHIGTDNLVLFCTFLAYRAEKY